MKKEDFEKLTNEMQEKLGKDNSMLIADSLGILISENDKMNKEILNRDTKIQKLEKDKENLITANGNLLQQVAMGIDKKQVENQKSNNEETPKQKFSFKNCFDEKGNFKK